MHCASFRAALHAYFMGRLSESDQGEVERHGGECPDCAPFFELCNEISCRELIEFLNEYVDGELDPERRAVFERHLALCRDCTNYLESYRQAMRMSVSAMRDTARTLGALPDELVRAILAARR